MFLLRGGVLRAVCGQLQPDDCGRQGLPCCPGAHSCCILDYCLLMGDVDMWFTLISTQHAVLTAASQLGQWWSASHRRPHTNLLYY